MNNLTKEQQSNYVLASQVVGVHSWADYFLTLFKANGLEGREKLEEFCNENPLSLTMYGYLCWASDKTIKPWRERKLDEYALAYAKVAMMMDFGPAFVNNWYLHKNTGGMGPIDCVFNMTHNEASEEDIRSWLMDYMYDFKLFIYEKLENSYKEDIIEASVAMSDMRTQREALTRHYTASEIYSKWKG